MTESTEQLDTHSLGVVRYFVDRWLLAVRSARRNDLHLDRVRVNESHLRVRVVLTVGQRHKVIQAVLLCAQACVDVRGGPPQHGLHVLATLAERLVHAVQHVLDTGKGTARRRRRQRHCDPIGKFSVRSSSGLRARKRRQWRMRPLMTRSWYS